MNKQANFWYIYFHLAYAFLLIFFSMAAIESVLMTPIFGMIGISAACASIFILLRGTSNPAASYRNIILSYCVALLVGIFFHWMVILSGSSNFLSNMPLLFECLSALAIMIVIGLFFVLHLNHPPAVGMTLGLVIESWTLNTLIVVVLSILGLVIFRALLVRYPIKLT